MGHSNLYSYQRLSSPRAVRICTLHPASERTAPLEVCLQEVSLDNGAINYEALSYVWGSLIGDRPLRCDQKTILVTANCESALRQLRHLEVGRMLWIDAICIDQGADVDSLREKDVQVAMMGEVYSRATRTLCWLGEGTTFTPDVFRQLDKIGSCPSRRGFMKLLQFDEALHRDGLLDQHLTSLNHVFCHPWHSRIWTVQEVAFSKTCQILCGSGALPWKTYHAAAEFIISEQYMDNLDSAADKSYVSISLREQLRGFVLSGDEADDSEDQQHRKSTFLTSCLGQVRRLQATDPKDRVYGLFAVFRALGVPLPAPNYTKQLAQVYEDAAVSLIAWSRSLQILCYAASNARDSTLPSWVPDLSDSAVRLIVPQSDATEGSHVGRTDARRLVPSAGHLHVRGKFVGKVTGRAAGDFADLDFDAGSRIADLPILTDATYHFSREPGNLRLLIHSVKLFRECARMLETLPLPPGHEASVDAAYALLDLGRDLASRAVFNLWWRVLLEPSALSTALHDAEALATPWKAADPANAAHWSAELMLCAVVAAFQVGQSLQASQAVPHAGKLMDMTIDFTANMGDRAFVVVRDYGLRKDFLGSAFHTVRNGDVLVLLEGAEFPVVLREFGEHWRFIGPAFVDGMMEGEAWSDIDGIVGDLSDLVIS